MQTEKIFVNVYGDKAEVIHGSTKGYAEYLAAFDKAEDKLEFNAKGEIE